MEELYKKVEKAKDVCKCEKKTLHEKAGNLSSLFKDILGYKKEDHFDFAVAPIFQEFEKTVAKRGESGIEKLTNHDLIHGASNFSGKLKNNSLPGDYNYYGFTIVEELQE